MRAIFSFLFIILAIVLFPVVVAAILLLIQAEVNHTRFFAFGILSLFLAIYLLIKRNFASMGYHGTWAVVFLLITAGLWGASFMASPKGTSKDTATGFQSVYASDEAVLYPRWHPANLIAERDQVRFALFLAGYAGIDFDDAHSADSRRAMKSVYDDLEYHEEALVDFGSQTYACYQEWLGQPNPALHHYVYRSPAGKAKPKMPVLLLLHGSGGNLKAGPWALKPLADEYGMALVAPTFGKGDWSSDAGAERIQEALNFCAKKSDLDESAVLVIGYGEGGQGVQQAAMKMPEKFRGFVHIASKFTEESIEGFADVLPLRKLPTLVLHGGKDRLVHVNEVEAAVTSVRRWQMPVTFQKFHEDGAMLLFARGEDVNNRISQWIKSWSKR